MLALFLWLQYDACDTSIWRIERVYMKPKKQEPQTTFTFRPKNQDVMDWARKRAASMDRSVTWYINNLIEQDKQQQEGAKQ